MLITVKDAIHKRRMKINMFEKICKMSQKNLKKYIANQLQATHNKVINSDGYVYAQGTFPVLLVAHLDTVHKELPKAILYDEDQDAMYSPQGIGGDDRCGVYMILQVIQKYNCSVLFCEDEEIGCVGAEKFIKTKLAKDLSFNYIIEFDRKGNNDAVFYDCDNADFEKFITKDFYKSSWGSFSDISVIAPALKCAAVNLSCGYYNAHTTGEYVVMSDMKRSIIEACKILERTTEDDKFEYIEYKNHWDYIGNESLSKMYFIEYLDDDGRPQYDEIYAISEEEAVGIFCMDHPTIPYGSIAVW